MSQHLALYRSFRPLTFSDVVAQRQVVVPLRQTVIRGDIGHAYLFTGTRGTGKTSLAKIFARAINCLHPQNGDPCNECEICRGILDGSILDIMEIDAASNNSVDNIRRITEEIVYLPARTKYKVYIIDEVHMLSQGAFNALLKTLEEPPEHAVFILATTEPHRIPATIMSRCQRYDFRRIPVPEIVGRLRYIATEENIQITDDALKTLANLADGALRDAVSLLDQVRSGNEGEITRADIIRMIGLVDDVFLEQMATALLSRNPARLISLVNDLMMSGRDLIRFVMDLSRYFRNLLVYKTSQGADELLSLSDRTLAGLKHLAPAVEVPIIIDIIEQLGVLQNNLKFNPDIRTGLEVGLIGISWKLPQILPANACDDIDEAVSDFDTPTAKESDTEAIHSSPAASTDSATAPEQSAISQAAEKPDTKTEQRKPKTKATISENVPNVESNTEVDSPSEATDTPDEISAMNETVSDSDSGTEPESEYEPEYKPEPADTDSIAELSSQGETAAPDSEDHPDVPPTYEYKEVWRQVLLKLRNDLRVDLQMLLASAEVSCKNGLWTICYPKDQKAHCDTVGKEENVTYLEGILRELGAPDKVEVIREDQNLAFNVNPDEAPWMKKVREAARKLNIPTEMED